MSSTLTWKRHALLIQIFFFISFLDYTLTDKSHIEKGCFFFFYVELDSSHFANILVDSVSLPTSLYILFLSSLSYCVTVTPASDTCYSNHRCLWLLTAWRNPEGSPQRTMLVVSFWVPTYEALWVLVCQEALTRNEFRIFGTI